ncbi:hypothetical protein Tco_0870170 [Tanacetum coccineum]
MGLVAAAMIVVFTSRSFHQSEIEYTKGLLRKEFDMKELGPARKILGMEIVRDKGSRTLKVSHLGYVQKILNNYKVDYGKSISVPLGAHFKFNVLDEGSEMDFKDPDKGRSITGYVFMVHGCVVSWKATLQHVVALSTTWANPVVVNCDNQSAIHLSRNAMFYERTKHINVRYHFIGEIMESKEIEVAKIGTKDNAADAFTKVVPRPKFKYCMKDTWCQN